MKLTRRQTLVAGVAAIAAPALAMRKSDMGEVLDQHDSLGLAALVKTRKVSPTELLDAAIVRVEATNPRLNFMAQQHYDYARKAIARGLPEGPFSGVPWLLKDLNTYIAGEVTEGGSRFYKGYRAQVTSELVRRIERAGFVIFGKTTTPEMGLTGTTENKLTGDTRNPWNPELTAGGSSGGAAAAVAAGVIPAAHATDGGGSIRIPASCCGLFGLKPSRGRVPMGPLRTEGWGGLSAHHAVTRSVRDSAAILDATNGVEPGSRYGVSAPAEGFLAQLKLKPGKLRIALMLDSPTGSPVHVDCRAAAETTAKLCESLGHDVDIAQPKWNVAEIGTAAFSVIAASVAADVVDRGKLLGVEPGPALLEPITLAFATFGKSISAMDMVRANNTLQVLAGNVARFMADYDVILAPTLAAPPLSLGRINLSPDCDFREWGQRVGTFSPFAQMANLTGQPSMSVPLATSSDGLPIGVMFTGRYGDEGTLFRLAAQLERAAPWSQRRPRLR